VTGFSVSTVQHKVSNDRDAAAGLGGRVRVQMRDYMFEWERTNEGRATLAA
jgi:hypothetical protein